MYRMARIGDVCDIRVPKGKVKTDHPNAKYPLINNNGEFMGKVMKYNLPVGSLLLTSSSQIFRFNEPVWTYEGIIIIPRNEIKSSYLYKTLFDSSSELFEKKGSKNVLHPWMIEDFQIPVPSIDEQY